MKENSLFEEWRKELGERVQKNMILIAILDS